MPKLDETSIFPFSVVMDIKTNDLSRQLWSPAGSITSSHTIPSSFWGPPRPPSVVGSSSRSKQTDICSSVWLRLCKDLLFFCRHSPFISKLKFKMQALGTGENPQIKPQPQHPSLPYSEAHQSTKAHIATVCGARALQGRDVVIFSGDDQPAPRKG